MDTTPRLVNITPVHATVTAHRVYVTAALGTYGLLDDAVRAAAAGNFTHLLATDVHTGEQWAIPA